MQDMIITTCIGTTQTDEQMKNMIAENKKLNNLFIYLILFNFMFMMKKDYLQSCINSEMIIQRIILCAGAIEYRS